MRSHSVPLFCTPGLGLEDDSMEVAWHWAREEAELDILARLQGSSLQRPAPQTRKRQKRARSKLVDADAQLLEEAILQNAAITARAAPAAEAQECDLCDFSDRIDLLGKVRAKRAMQSRNWKPRFCIGDRVDCNCKDGWCQANIVEHRYREPEWNKGRFVAYQCRLDDGALVFAPLDHDSCVRTIR